MDRGIAPNHALKAAIDALGSQVALSALIGVGQPAISKWLAKGSQLPPEYVLTVERATGISKHDLRPDIYPRDLVSPPANDLEPAR